MLSLSVKSGWKKRTQWWWRRAGGEQTKRTIRKAQCSLGPNRSCRKTGLFVNPSEKGYWSLKRSLTMESSGHSRITAGWIKERWKKWTVNAQWPITEQLRRQGQSLLLKKVQHCSKMPTQKCGDFLKLEAENNRVEDIKGVEEKGCDWWSDAEAKWEAVSKTQSRLILGSEEKDQGLTLKVRVQETLYYFSSVMKETKSG